MMCSSMDIVKQGINEKISLSRNARQVKWTCAVYLFQILHACVPMFIPNIACLCSNVNSEVTHFKNWKILS